MSNRRAAKASLGLRAHSGWAVIVSVGGSGHPAAVLDRRRVELVDAAHPECRQPYHAAQGLPVQNAKSLIEDCGERARQLAREAVGAALAALRRDTLDARSCGLLLGSSRPLPGLQGILASHAMIHAAEGELFRGVLAEAAAHFGLAVVGLREREIEAAAATALRTAAPALGGLLREQGRRLGPPWRRDEKLATLAAWVAMARRAKS